MLRRTAALAKLTLPRLHAVTRRERLFKVVKEHCENHPLVWVAGPPGAGKTSLVAGYLTEHKQRTLWYHVDHGDADLATFFHYLAQAAQTAAARKQLRLPALTPEYMADVPGFTRRFMRELWAKVPPPAVLVLDNYQDLPAEAALHSMLPVGLVEFPADATLIVISRDEPPSHFARELTHNRVGHIRWEHLRLTLEETLSLASSVPHIDKETVASLHAKANGWVAGTVLMLERLKAKNIWNGHAPSDMTEVFHYFANQVFERMNPQAREALMRTALLPWVTETMAEEVSDHPGTAQVVRDLYQRGLFVDRRTDTQVRYQYHDLFREFLLDRCRMHFDGENLHRLKRTAAQVAEKYGQQDTAVALYAETNSWDDLSRLICESAEKLLSQGRNQTLQGYVALVPLDERQHRPWLLYWSGMSRLLLDPLTARKDLEAAYQQFERTNQDLAGLFLSCGAIIESYWCGQDDMAPAISWGDQLQRLLRQLNGFPSQAIEAKVLACLQGLVYASSDHPLLTEVEQSADQILRSGGAPQDYFGVATTFINLSLWRGDFRRVSQMLDQVNLRMTNTIVRPATLLNWKAMEASCAWFMRGQFAVKLQEALDLAETYGIVVFKPMIWGIQAIAALADGEDRRAEKFQELTQKATRPGQRFALGQCIHYRAGIALMRGDLDLALDQAKLAVTMTASLSSFHDGILSPGAGKSADRIGTVR